MARAPAAQGLISIIKMTIFFLKIKGFLLRNLLSFVFRGLNINNYMAYLAIWCVVCDVDDGALILERELISLHFFVLVKLKTV